MSTLDFGPYPVPPLDERTMDKVVLDLASLWRCPIRDDSFRAISRALSSCKGCSTDLCQPIGSIDTPPVTPPPEAIRSAVSLQTGQYTQVHGVCTARRRPIVQRPSLLLDDVAGVARLVDPKGDRLENFPPALRWKNASPLGDPRGRTIEFKDLFDWTKSLFHIAVFEDGIFLGTGKTPKYTACWTRPATSAHEAMRILANAAAAKDLLIRTFGCNTFGLAQNT